MNIHRRWKTLTPLIAALALLSVALGHACVEDGPEQAQAWPERDVLALSPAWLDALPAPERRDLQQRLTDHIVQQAEGGAWAEATPLDPDAPLGLSLLALDHNREARGDAPLLVQWIDEDGPLTARACWLTERDLTDPLQDGDAPALRWSLDPAFADHLLDGATERDALSDRLTRLDRWALRCLEDAGERLDPLAPSALQPTLELHRADGAPALLTLWPQRRVALLNPLLLALWTPERDAPQDELRTRADALTVSELDACTRDIELFCSTCDTPAKVQQAQLNNPGACTRQLFTTGEVWESCTKLNFEIARGYYRYCINSYMGSFTSGNGGPPTDVAGCMAGQTHPSNGQDLRTACDPRFVGTAEELAGAYLGFIRADTSAACQQGFITCAPQPQQPIDTNPTDQEDDLCASCEDGECNGENAFGLDLLCDVDDADQQEAP